MSDKSMHGATHIKARSGVYQYDRRVPKHIRDAFASLPPEALAQLPDDVNAYFRNKIHIRFSLTTGDKKLAKTLGSQADLKFDDLVSRFDARQVIHSNPLFSTTGIRESICLIEFQAVT